MDFLCFVCVYIYTHTFIIEQYRIYILYIIGDKDRGHEYEREQEEDSWEDLEEENYVITL